MAVTDNTYFAPILPDFSQFFGDVDKKAREGGKRAGKEFSDSVGSSLKSAERAADKFADTYKRAQDRAADAAGNTRVAQDKLNEVLNDSSASTSKIRAATEKYEKAQRDEARAVAASEKAAKNLADAQDQVAKATSEAGDEFRMGTGGLDEYGAAMDNAKGKVTDFVKNMAGVAGVAGVGAMLMEGMDVSGAVNKMNNQLGLTGEAAKSMSDEVSGVLRSGFAGSVEEAAGAVGSLSSNISYLGFEGEKTAEELSKPLLAFTSTFEADMDETTQVVSQLLHNGLAKDATEAFDLMTAAYQRVPAAMRDELPDIMNEYGTYFQSMGFSGQDAFGLVVNAAQNGKIEMDKVGDAIKEFGIRASDLGDTGAVEALDAIGLAGADVQNRLLAGGEGAKDAFNEVVQGLLEIPDPAKQAEAAVALFGTPLEDLDKAKIPGFLEGLGSAGDAMTGFAGSSDELSESVGGTLSSRLDALKGAVLDLSGNAFMAIWDVVQNNVIPAFQSFGDWVQRNQAWLGPLAAAITGAVGAWALWTGAIKTWQTVTKIATGIQAAFNAVMAVNPIMLIVMAVAALVAGLVYFFTQTETGKEMWASFTEALGNGWQWVVDKFSAGVEWIKTKWTEFSTAISDFWTSYIQPVFSAISTVVQNVLGVVFAVVVGSALAAWNLLSSGISWAWNTLIKPAWDAMSSAISNLWTTYVSPIVQWIGDKWNWVTSAISAGVNYLTGVVWPAMTSAISNLWTTYVSPIVQWIGDKWNWVKDTISAGVNYLTGVVWPAMSNAISNLWTTYVSPIVQWIGDKWNWVKDTINSGVTFVTDTVFPAFHGALQGLRDFFGSIVDGITSVWNTLRGALAKPINFMINTVYNDGILAAWNTIAGILPGLEKGSPLAGIPEYAVGGAVRGPGTGTSDDIPALLSNGEHVWTAKEVSGAGGQGAIYAMRNAVAAGRGFTYDGNNLALLPNTLDNRVGDLAGAAPDLLVNKYAKGGEVRPLWEAQLMRGHEWAKSRHGRPYVLGGSANGGGGTDCSGFMSGIANVIQGGDGARQWATMAFNGGGNQQYPNGHQGFVAGLKANTLSIGVTNGGAAGGHTAGTLGAVGAYPATNVESGGAPSMVKYGVGAAGADDGYFNTHYHLPIGPDGAFVSGGNGSVSPEAMSSAISKKLGGAIDKIMGPIVDLLPTKPPEWQGIPKGMYDKGKNGLTDFVGNAVGQLGDKLASVYSAVQGMGDLVKDAAKGTWGWITDNLDVFDTGGVLKPGAMAVNKSKHPELIINHAQLGAFNRLAGALGVSAESMQVMAKELNEAYAGGDWGYGELARVLGNEEWAKALVNGAADLGEFMRTYGDVVADVGKAVSDHFTTEAGNVLSLWGLEDLAGFEVRDEFKPGNLRAAGDNLWAWYNDPNYVHPDNIKDEESTITTPSVTTSGVDAVTTTAAASTPETKSTSATEETTVIKATSADDMVRVGDLEELNGRVVRIEVELDKAGKVPAGATTRGGVV